MVGAYNDVVTYNPAAVYEIKDVGAVALCWKFKQKPVLPMSPASLPSVT